MWQLEFFKKYCEDRGLLRSYAFGDIDADGTKSLVFFDGFKSRHLAYHGKKLIHGELYEVAGATCSETSQCEIGKPAKKCVDSEIYSDTKCAVYFFDPFDLDSFRYQFTFEQLKALKQSL